MSVSELGRLLETGQYRRCLEQATALLEDGRHGAEEIARIQAAICRSCLELTDHFAAIRAGRQAVRLAQQSGSSDLVGFALVDLATALGAVRQVEESLELFQTYLDSQEQYTAARCRQGAALFRMAEVLYRAGQLMEAKERYLQAQQWFERFGDEAAVGDCRRGLIHVHLHLGESDKAWPLLKENERHSEAYPENQNTYCDHLLDQSLYYLIKSQYPESIQRAFQALDAAGDRHDQQARAHLLLCENALAEGKPVEALSFAFAARVAAIDGRVYDLEFEAADRLFRLLRERGVRILKEVESDFYRQEIDIYQYLSDPVLKRMFRSN